MRTLFLAVGGIVLGVVAVLAIRELGAANEALAVTGTSSPALTIERTTISREITRAQSRAGTPRSAGPAFDPHRIVLLGIRNSTFGH